MRKEQSIGPPVRAIVKNIVIQSPEEKSYAVAYPLESRGELKEGESVTFSLSKWNGRGIDLCHGQVVDLYSVTLFSQGWRADDARPITPSNEQSAERSG